MTKFKVMVHLAVRGIGKGSVTLIGHEVHTVGEFEVLTLSRSVMMAIFQTFLFADSIIATHVAESSVIS